MQEINPISIQAIKSGRGKTCCKDKVAFGYCRLHSLSVIASFEGSIIAALLVFRVIVIWVNLKIERL